MINFAKHSFCLALAVFTLISCANSASIKAHAPITAEEQRRIDNPPQYLLDAIATRIPEERAILREQEAYALEEGRPLRPFELELAQKVGVAHPERVRLLATFDMPSSEANIHGTFVVAQVIGYAIYFRPDMIGDNPKYYEILAHELAHVRQFEVYGIDQMIERSFVETVVLGPGKLPLVEREAIEWGHRGYDDPNTVYGF